MKQIIKSNLRDAEQVLALYRALVDQAQQSYLTLRKQEKAAIRRVHRLKGQLHDAQSVSR